ncbi:hypothetical protein STEG23_014299 [Scotinomys teguina]
MLMEKPDVVVRTPFRILNHLQQDSLKLQDSLELLELLVVDEADLLFSFGFEDELKSLLCHLPLIYQAFLMDAMTKQAIPEVRLKEIKEERLHSEKLKTYFEDNPRDLQLLRHDPPLYPAVVKPHLGNDDYLIPAALRGLVHPQKKWRKLPHSRKAKKFSSGNPEEPGKELEPWLLHISQMIKIWQISE